MSGPEMFSKNAKRLTEEKEKKIGDMQWALFQHILAAVDKDKLAKRLSIYKYPDIEKIMPLLRDALSDEVLRQLFPYFYDTGMVNVETFLKTAEGAVNDLLHGQQVKSVTSHPNFIL